MPHRTRDKALRGSNFKPKAPHADGAHIIIIKMAQPRYDHSVAGLGEENFEKLRTCKVLVVGAGGIGCELLKNLVLVGCEKLTVVDLDTIDVSNLN